MKTVPLGPVLAVIHDRLVCGFDDYREFLSYMTNADVPLWDVARARKAANTTLRRQHPLLVGYVPPEKTDNGSAGRYVRTTAAKIGKEQVRVRPLDKGKFKPRTLSGALR